MVDPRRVMLLLARLVPAVVFVDVIRATVVALPALLQLASAEPRPTVLLPSAVALVVSGVSAALAVATGSVLAYSVALVALVLAKIPVGPGFVDSGGSALPAERAVLGAWTAGIELPWTGVAGLPVLLALDSYATVYRRRGTGLPDPALRSVLKSLGTFLALSAPFVVVAAILGSYLSALLNLLDDLPSKLSESPLRFLAESRLTYAVLASVAFLALVKLMDSVTGIMAPFLLPSRRLSLSVLLDETDLNRVFAPPLLGTVLGLAALAFYPAVHALLFEAILEVPEELGIWASVLTHAVSLFVTSYAVFGSVERSLLRTRARRIGPALLVLSLVYAGAVSTSIKRGSDPLRSLLAPDSAGLLEVLGRSYSDYARGFLLLLESLFRLLGVAP